MKLPVIIEKLGFGVASKTPGLDRDVTRGYVSDLLSDVLANCNEGDLWITLQIHPNIIGIASMKGLGGIVIIGGRNPQEDTLKKAEEENIPVMVSDLPAFEVAGRLHALGISG